MREIVSPLDGIRSPFGSSVSPLAIYAVLGIRPELVLDFDDEKYFANSASTTFSDAITHSASSNATMVDSDGLLKWRPHNLLPWSENINACFPNKDSVSVSGSQVTANSGTGFKAIRRNVTDITRLESRTLRAKITAGTHDYAYITIRGAFSSWITAVFDLSNGTVSEEATDSAAIEDASISPDGDGYICVIKGRVGSDGSENIKIGLAESATGNTFDVSEGTVDWQSAALGTETIFVTEVASYRSDLGGMVNNPDRGDSYVPTTSSAVYLPRRGHHVYNGTSWVNEGLLHESEARTNLITYSNDLSFWTNVATSDAQNVIGVISPDGGHTANKITEDSTASRHSIELAVGTVTSGVTYSISVWLKKKDRRYVQLAPGGSGFGFSSFANFDFDTETVTASSGVVSSVEKYANGWFRFAVQAVAVATNTGALIVSHVTTGAAARLESFTGDGVSETYVYGAQVEQASTPSSYIPTSGATVTRAAETLTIPSAKLPWPTPNVIGPELVTNGDFSNGDAGYIEAGGAWVFQNGRAEINAVSGFDSFGQSSIGISSEKAYLLEFDYEVTSGGLGVSLNSPGVAYISLGNIGIGSGRASFIAVLAPSQSDGFQIRHSNGAVAWVDNISVREIDPLAVSIQMEGRATGDTYTTTRWYLDANNYITQEINTSDFTFEQAASGTVDAVTGGSFTSGINVPFNIASRHGSTFINGAVDGTALTADTTPTALPDLSATDLNLGFDYMGTIKMLRIWADDLGDTGIAEASA